MINGRGAVTNNGAVTEDACVSDAVRCPDLPSTRPDCGRFVAASDLPLHAAVRASAELSAHAGASMPLP
eukprot:CAMPEP_0115366442 /NCGR_PEP_ID=MMETSP0270-20121206/104811_1 /TAXON_ID=71861 /ORGANISM="Scrippsiella trochoidea, Strain CCMP3099" /LENGTH=68 /DNA_ID=CAMNT_0002789221 /DNA_START=25 /DNA_END=227 /DNA_ORIENTATION=-